MSEERFLEECQNTEHYQPEAPKENMSRKHEGRGGYWKETFGRLQEGGKQ
ncbi:GH-E family nuclease [Halovivax cerinus]|uniref:GH-E family nuclease n=1 Tax=Halovivax cerinus TaxID=1487865 RepID=A0ABD5NQI6_9EURY